MPDRKPTDSVVTIDTGYLNAPHHTAAYLVIEGDRAAFVDNNTSHAVPRLLEALDQAGRSPEAVDWLIVTHVHLDHAGGTAELLKHCPNATVVAHPKAARHLIDPAKLIKGAKAVYGDQTFETLYGTIEGVPEDRVRRVEDAETLDWGARTFTFLHTLGHASHHMVIHDSKTNGVFAGDALGIGNGPHVRPGPAFVIAATAPPDFDPEEARHAVRRILDTGCERAYLTHFGCFEDVEEIAAKLLRNIDQHEAIVEEAHRQNVPDEQLQAYCLERVQNILDDQLQHCGVSHIDEDRQRIEGDVALNAMGIAHRVKKLRT
jgi:glyoxylase-like metal-dependent hydrolase (beta-lactamase superfamily II)